MLRAIVRNRGVTAALTAGVASSAVLRSHAAPACQSVQPLVAYSAATASSATQTAAASTPTTAASKAALTLPPLAPSPVHVVLYQYNSCPFCNKVRAYLDYARIPYAVVEVNPLFKSEIKWSTDYRKVPIAVVNGMQLNDSDEIIARIDETLKAAGARRVVNSQGCRAAGTGSEEEAAQLAWVSNKLIHTLSPNLYATLSEAVESFDYITQRNFPAWSALATKYIGAVAMYGVTKKLKKRHGIADGQERQALYDACRQWMTTVGEHRPFLGGDAPNRADLAVFGVLRALMPLPVGRELLAQDAALTAWYTRMTNAVGRSSLQHRIMEAPSAQ